MRYEKQTSIDKPQCPNGHGNMEVEKTWSMKGKGEHTMIITLWRCPRCRATHRGTKVEKPAKGETTR